MEEGSSRGGGKHFVLVHGLCHGAWCWYKLAPLLEAAGHRVTAVDLAASGKPMGVTIEEFFRRVTPDFFMDSETLVLDTDQGPQTAVLLGPKLLAAKLYDRSSTEDVTLARMLVRPGNQFRDDPMMKDEALLTAGNYGSVKKVYVVVMADACSSEEEQRWMVGLSPDTEVREIAGADHMAMCSKPSELCHVLLRVASECA